MVSKFQVAKHPSWGRCSPRNPASLSESRVDMQNLLRATTNVIIRTIFCAACGMESVSWEVTEEGV